jgi:hypothetical protein
MVNEKLRLNAPLAETLPVTEKSRGADAVPAAFTAMAVVAAETPSVPTTGANTILASSGLKAAIESAKPVSLRRADLRDVIKVLKISGRNFEGG